LSARAWSAFAAVSVLWGIPYLFIKVAVDDGVPPVFLAWARVALGAAVLLAIAHRAGVLGQTRGRLGVIAAYVLVEICIPFPLIAAGERHVSSSLTAILIATVPLIVAVMAMRYDKAERVTGRRLLGLLLGFAGVVALVGIDVAGDGDELLGVGLILLAAVGYSAGPIILNRHLTDVDARAMMAVALAIGAVALAPFAALDVPDQRPSGEALGSIVALGLFCTAAALTLFTVLIADVGPSRASVITYVAPVVALVLGIAILDERPGAGTVVGLVLIVAGSWLATRGRAAAGVEPEPVAR
jgi:drug/metabolite transporter (DMT)-like permease